jgi:hypothetical protein
MNDEALRYAKAMATLLILMIFLLVFSKMLMNHQIDVEKIRANSKQSEMFFHKLSP